MYTVVVSASDNYCPGLSAFLNSFFHYHDADRYKIKVCDFNISDDFWEYMYKNSDLPRWDVERIPINNPRGKIWACKIERFRVAVETGGVVGLFDSDMFFCGSYDNYFRSAEAGMIVGGANASNYGFGKHWESKYRIEVPEIFDYKTITSVPTIMDVDKHGDVWQNLYDHKEKIGTGADFDLTNIFLMKGGKLDDIMVIPAQQCTGIHHFQIKPGTGIIDKAGVLLTGDGLQLLSVHGKWWSGDWYENLMKPMPKYCARLGVYDPNSRCIQDAIKSRARIKEEFDRWCDWPYAWSVKDATQKNIEHEMETYLSEAKGSRGIEERQELRTAVGRVNSYADQLSNMCQNLAQLINQLGRI